MLMTKARAVPTGLAAVLLSAACFGQPERMVQAAPTLWTELQRRCGQAFEGRVVEGTESSDDAMRRARLVMHVRSCSEDELRIPFHVGENRSRTWVITRQGSGLRLKHVHRHEDGSPDATTDYGGDSRGPDARTVEFPADAHTATLLPAAASNVWTLSVEGGAIFSYALRRENSPRRFRADFDLTRPVDAPPAPW